MTKSNPTKAMQPPVSLGGIVEESLPLPFVHYPNHYGTFFTFSDTREGIPYLCECSKGTIENYIELREKTATQSDTEYFYEGKNLDNLHFPDSLKHVSFEKGCNPLQILRFKRGICHRCNIVPPTMRYCHEMYGVRFIQHFGWYVEQAYLRFGILPRNSVYLNDITPDEFVEDIASIQSARIGANKAMEWFRERDEITRFRILDPSLPESKFDEREIARRQDILRESTKNARQAERKLSKKIENIVREEFGFRKVGERWTSETLVYRIICNLFPHNEVLRHHRPDWLGGLELDIFVPDCKIAIEYQGQQHFHPIKAWGGEQSLHKLRERDKRKARICVEKGIHLVSVDYTEPLTQTHIQARIKEMLMK